ncbi:MAG: saccharopine dehydrogenase NADP-binding domain-containing protein [Chitinophagaceae bacterium]|nr:saccharopine dehydrogenase NADP-binding domain-containing protein [Bacteroidota bacterium]MCC6257309.1 saccharopine dehydrogenase NADP-binding domain-containing protein [Chitinophagaceae bacterium]MCW5916684.1 saccharopine dehydrogenase NADP-binding domain-containing protein [Ferruginibacter sp.]
MNPSKKILLFGAGKSTTSLIRYLLSFAEADCLEICIADTNINQAREKIGNSPYGMAIQLDISNAEERKSLIKKADLVISMMPPALHILVARDCVAEGKSLLTASYADEAMKSLNEEVARKGLLFLCEMGLDPGIDHMSAMQIIEQIRAKGGVIKKFFSHCGGLIAPESDDNPWHYKITWNPRNVVTAGMGGAKFLEDGNISKMEYAKLFDSNRKVTTGNEQVPYLSYYPNRDSLPYISLYNLHTCSDFMRTTLRYPSFMTGWLQMIELGFTDETISYQTNGMSIGSFFHAHLKSRNLDPEKPGAFITREFREQLEFLGLHDTGTPINLGEASIIEIMQFILQTKLVMHRTDKDLVVMIHEFLYEWKGKNFILHSSLFLKGIDNEETAMAKTVGLPLGIAARKILNGEIKSKGVRIPIEQEIYSQVLPELESLGIKFMEREEMVL